MTCIENAQPAYLTLQGHHLERVECFKYLGLLLTSDLSWSTHVDSICSKARKLLRLLYRKYYQHAELQILLQLYVSLVRPRLEYASPVWNPYLQKNINTLENVQNLPSECAPNAGIRPIPNFSSHLTSLNCLNADSTLTSAPCSKLCTDYLIFPLAFLILTQVENQSTNRPFLFYRPFARTNYFYNSFVPRTVSIWNTLPVSLVSNSYVPHFRSHVWMHITH